MKNYHLGKIAALPVAALLLAGCVSEKHELENVNKDWNKIIRASHIYPIYPLTEDLQPGDVFIAHEDIEDTSPWTGKGYLKLDHLFTRLMLTNYPTFYQLSFDVTNPVPHYWVHDHSWTNAPMAAFPSYSFKIKQGGGANVSLPISGIPVGLGLMGAKSVSGHVTIADAHTYGVDEMPLQAKLNQFVAHNRTSLLHWLDMQDNTNGPYFLRVVSRVYLTQKVAVSMVQDTAFGATASGGVPKDVPIPDTQGADAPANYSNMVNAVNGVVSSLHAAATSAGGVAPGGTLKFTAVSSRSVSLEEKFERPIVIGYNGFDVSFSRADLEPRARTLEDTNQVFIHAVPRKKLTKKLSSAK
jgi:hypothetical protein